MPVRYALLLCVLLVFVSSAGADNQPTVDQSQFPPTYVPSGEHLYQQFCAACHGSDAKGHGPAADSLKRPPVNLTMLAKHNGGKFPYDSVSNTLLFGPGTSAHGSAAMPTCGPVFLFLDKRNEAAARQRIKRLCDYLASMQEK